jgi:hypothetical protein
VPVKIFPQSRKAFLRKVLTDRWNMGCTHSPGLDPGGGGPVIVRDRLASVPGGRGDCLRASLWVTAAQRWYANRQVRPGPDMVAVDEAVRTQHRSGREGELDFNARAYDYRRVSVHIALIL